MKKIACILVLLSVVLVASACRNPSSESEPDMEVLTQEIEQLKAENSRLTTETARLKELEAELEGLRNEAEKLRLLPDRYTMLKHSYKALLEVVHLHPEILPIRVDADDPLKKSVFEAVQDIQALTPLKENQFAVRAYAQLVQENEAFIEVVYIETMNEGDEENEQIRTGSYTTIHLDKQNGKWVLRK